MDKKKSATPASATNKSATDAKSGSGTAKGKGKGKKARAREEEERKRLEEEERLRHEQEEKERKEREQKEREEQDKRQKKIMELKKLELTEFYDILRNINEKISNHHKNERAQREWNRYIKCDGTPNPTVASEINSFMTLWKEDKENNDIDNSFRFTDLSLKLVDEIHSIINQTSENEENSNKKITGYNQIITELENCLWAKINEASHRLLRDASYHVDPESLNYDECMGDSTLYYCFWANLSHNPRIKDFGFAKKQYSFNLPRPLTLAHVAIRVLFMNFDIYSSRSRTYKCSIKNEVYEFDPIPEEKVEEVKVEENDAEREITEDDLLPPELRAMMEKTDLEKEEEEAAKLEKEKSEIKAVEKPPEPIDSGKKQIDPEEYARLQELSDSYVIDLRNFMPVGPIVHFGLYNIPPQPKKVKQWTITQKDHVDQLTDYHYPTQEPAVLEYAWQEFLKKKEGGDAPEDAAEALKAKKSELLASLKPADDPAVEEANRKAEHIAKSLKNEGPVEVHYKLPKTVFYSEAPVLARWDTKKLHWRTDEIIDLAYSEETGDISFKTYHFSPYCLLQDRHVHMPIQSWRLTPREETNTCMFYIESSAFEMNIEIRSNEVRVYLPPKKVIEDDPKAKKTPLGYQSKKIETPKEEPENENEKYRNAVESFANKWFPLHTLMKILKSVGLNIFPEPDSDKFVTITTKDKKLEWSIYQNMALCSNIMAFAYSRWNMEINDEKKIVLLGLLHHSNSKPNLDKYQCVVCTNDIYKMVECNESSDELNETCYPGTEEHASLFNICCELVRNKDPLVNRMTQMDALYFETCAKLLEATKVVTFS